jgi:hypothetical protein
MGRPVPSMKTQAVVLLSHRRWWAAGPAATAVVVVVSPSIRARAALPVRFAVRSAVLAETRRLPATSSTRFAARANGTSLPAAVTALSNAAEVVRSCTPRIWSAGKNPVAQSRQ